MTTLLIHEALRLLQSQMEPSVDIPLTADAVPWADISAILQQSGLEHGRKVTILACCILIRLAILKHAQLAVRDNASLTRSILDGDYLSGLLYRLASRRREWKLLQLLAPLQKRMQLQLLRGRPAEALYAEQRREIAAYLNKQCA